MVYSTRLIVILLHCGICAIAQAATVHQWVDEDGVTHFSDAPPEGAFSDARTLELSDDFPETADARGNYYSIANQWERMRQERDAKTQLALQKERLRADRAAAASEQHGADQSYEPRYFPSYFPPYGANRFPLGRGLNNRGPVYRDPVSPRRNRTHVNGGTHLRGADGRGARRTGRAVTQPRHSNRTARGGFGPRSDDRR